MAFKVINELPGLGAIEYLAPTSTSFTAGDLIFRNTSTNFVNKCTATTGDATTVEAIVTKTATTGTGTVYVKATPIFPGTFVVADCTNNTADNQLNIAHLLTDAGTVNNTSTHSTDINAIFIALKVVGAASDKKLFGYIAKTGQVTA